MASVERSILRNMIKSQLKTNKIQDAWRRHQIYKFQVKGENSLFSFKHYLYNIFFNSKSKSRYAFRKLYLNILRRINKI